MSNTEAAVASSAWPRVRKLACAAVVWAVALAAITVAWSFVLAWYGLIVGFWFIVIPFRLFRRSQRRQTALLETIAYGESSTRFITAPLSFIGSAQRITAWATTLSGEIMS